MMKLFSAIRFAVIIISRFLRYSIIFIDLFDPGKDFHEYRHHDAVARELIQLGVGQTKPILQLEKLLIGKSHETEAHSCGISLRMQPLWTIP